MIYRISENIDERYNKLSRWGKVLLLAAIIVIILLLIITACLAVHYKNQRSDAIAEYERLLEKSLQNYYIQGVANSNLEKQLQDLSIELATLRNNTLDLEKVLNDWRSDYRDLSEIRKRMKDGIRKTNAQLDAMSKSVGSIIDQRQYELNMDASEVIIKRDSLGRRARLPEKR